MKIFACVHRLNKSKFPSGMLRELSSNLMKVRVKESMEQSRRRGTDRRRNPYTYGVQGRIDLTRTFREVASREEPKTTEQLKVGTSSDVNV